MATLANKGALVTGGSRGFGAVIVMRLARGLGPRGITVNNVQPGPVDTDMNPAESDFAEMLRPRVMALPRYGTADEIAAMVA
jgi:3-oxoacyl-[acyl-carrier protein] reductase